jgi:ATP-dependent DNA helicase RecG
MNDIEYIKKILKENESEQLSFFADFSFESISKTVCAFLNSKGGRILIGFDGNKKTVGLTDFKERFKKLRSYIYDNITPESIINITQFDYNENKIVLIDVIEGTKQPYSVLQKIYVRRGERTMTATPEELSVLIRKRKEEEYHWERLTQMDITLEELDKEEIVKTIQLANEIGRTNKYSTDNPFQFLTRFGLYRNNYFTNAAVVLFAKEPTKYLPQCRIRIVELPEGKTGSHFDNSILIEGNLFNAYEQLLSYFKKSVPLISKFSKEEWQRKDRFKYPMEALDEGILNAIIHRDYSDISGSVFIGIYPDKLEITNSGELPASITASDLKRNHLSIPPNPDIAHIFYLRGLIEKIGRGTLKIIEQCKESGLKDPKWLSKSGSVTLTFFDAESKKVKEISVNDLNKRQHKILKVLSEKEALTVAQIIEHLKENITGRSIRNDLKILVESGLVLSKGKARNTEYLRTAKNI